jgi:hypothetical protein
LLLCHRVKADVMDTHIHSERGAFDESSAHWTEL